MRNSVRMNPGASPLPVWTADLLTTVAIGAVLLAIARWLLGRVGFLRETHIPAPALGGLLFALLVFALRSQMQIRIDTTLRSPLQTFFFATLGFQASVELLRAGGRPLIAFWGIAALSAIVQNVVGIGLAALLGAPLLLGLMCGSVTLVGGPATALAFGEIIERAGLPGAPGIGIAAATFGILVSSLVGNPLAVWLMGRQQRAKAADPGKHSATTVASVQLSPESLLRNAILLAVATGIGLILSSGLASMGWTMPLFIGPMIVAGFMRFLHDRGFGLGFDAVAMQALSALSLSFFLVLALMDLRLWELAGLALPMLFILAAETLLTLAIAALTTFLWLGRDYQAAVMASGHVGFGLGITANAVANMRALEERFGPAPRAFLIVPIIGAFFSDLTNSLIITATLNLLRSL
jgi:glutamate:Na+ symporter, ESS family